MDQDQFYTGFSSLAIHGAHKKDPNYAHLTPIYASSTFVYDSAQQGMRRFSGEEEGYIYSRWGNPSTAEAANKIAAMESFGLKDASGNPLKSKAFLHSSGMGAISTMLFALLKKGDKILTHYSLYGGTQEIFNQLLPELGIEAIIVDFRDPGLVEQKLKDNNDITLVYIETPANPTIQCVDIEKITETAHRYNTKVVCDNTFATPYLQQPFKYGVDFIVHSTTKFLNGHGTSIGGAFVGRDEEFMETKVEKVSKFIGATCSPFDAFLLINGMKTLEIRMEKHCENALKVAEYLDQHEAIEKLHYNGLPSHPDYAIAEKQMKLPGAMMSFELKGGLKAGITMMDSLRMCTRTVSLGTCDTLLSHPASMTHYGVPREQRIKYGITDGLIRMSVGLENIHDILEDLNQSLQKTI